MKPIPLTPGESLAAALDAELPDSRVAAAISDALSATVTTRAGITEADHKTRLAAATLALHFRHGRPVERQEVVSVHVGTDSNESLKARLARSPALRRAVRGMLEEADGASVIDA